MKKILVPTDFSENAANALRYAAFLANQFGSQITLLHTYKVYNTTGSFVSVESFIKEDASRDMLVVMKDIEGLLEHGATIESKIVKGSAVDTICEVAEKQDFDLIIMGTQGASGLAEIFIGSTTNGVLKNTGVPVLAIPADFAFRPIKNVVLAVDEEEDFDPELLQPLVQIVRSQNAMLRVYHKDVHNDGPNTAVDALLEGLERSYHYELDTDNINLSITKFVEEIHADMLCMIRRRRSFLESVFHESVTTKAVFNSPIPLLILQE
ncbi:MAG TPA: universal stress protein [Saprospiraceae bacterium]|nr:universal stress protein [Saprospiraceae bacterium]HMP12703.1 universal stress protein [Saprospiraceae bacterium]